MVRGILADGHPAAFCSRLLHSFSSGHFTTLAGKISVRHERYFFAISQQKPGKRYFGVRKILTGFRHLLSVTSECVND
jgi:hypothetical protein